MASHTVSKKENGKCYTSINQSMFIKSIILVINFDSYGSLHYAHSILFIYWYVRFNFQLLIRFSDFDTRLILSIFLMFSYSLFSVF